MSAEQRTIQTVSPPPQREEHKPALDDKVRGTLPRESEKEKIKRQLYNLIDRVDKL
jgi:hypothetical protein